MIIQIIGLPGSGKTTLALELKKRLNAIHINADEARATVNSDLGFGLNDRIENSRRLGEIARLIANQKTNHVIVDFVCPTADTRKAFGKPDILVWVDRVESGRYEDTNAIWENPLDVDVHILKEMTVEDEAVMVINHAKIHDWTQPTTLQLGRYQPWHEGHSALYDAGLERTAQVLVGVRNTEGTSEKDPLPYDRVEEYIRQDRPDALILRLPNITNIIYGRDVGYKIEKIELSQELQQISATQKRKDMGL
jgi:hypothetical protein